MPKIITEHEREQTKNAITNSTKRLIQAKKGIKNITVDEIIKTVGVGKSSFYSYFISKEECIYEVVANSRIELINQFERIMLTSQPQREKIIRFLREVYLAEDSISNYISSNDMALLLRKLPPKYSEREEEMSISIFTNMMNLLNLGRSQTETITVLLDCLDRIVTYVDTSKQVREEALNTLIMSITEYVENNSETQIEL